MKKYIWLVAILFAACAEQNQEPKTAGYFIQDEEQSYMIGSDETTLKKEAMINFFIYLIFIFRLKFNQKA